MEVGLFEAKNRLSELVAKAEAGEEVVITRRGQAVAKLVAAAPAYDRAAAEAAMHRMAAIRKTINPPVTLAEIKEWINEGRM